MNALQMVPLCIMGYIRCKGGRSCFFPRSAVPTLSLVSNHNWQNLEIQHKPQHSIIHVNFGDSKKDPLISANPKAWNSRYIPVLSRHTLVCPHAPNPKFPCPKVNKLCQVRYPRSKEAPVAKPSQSPPIIIKPPRLKGLKGFVCRYTCMYAYIYVDVGEWRKQVEAMPLLFRVKG